MKYTTIKYYKMSYVIESEGFGNPNCGPYYHVVQQKYIIIKFLIQLFVVQTHTNK